MREPLPDGPPPSASLHVDVVLRGRTIQLLSAAPAVGVLGPSGVGKSTLLRILAGLERRAVGTVRALGETWLGPHVWVEPWRRRVGWVPQDSALFPHLSVRSNLAYGGSADPDGGSEVAAMAERLGLTSVLDRAPRHLSGGERQRVALGRALLSAPRLLLLDEPFAALERPLRLGLGAEVAALCRERRLPVVIVSHDEADLAQLDAEVWAFGEGGLGRR